MTFKIKKNLIILRIRVFLNIHFTGLLGDNVLLFYIILICSIEYRLREKKLKIILQK